MNDTKEEKVISIFLTPLVVIFKLIIYIFNHFFIILASINFIIAHICGFKLFIIFKNNQIFDMKYCFLTIIFLISTILYFFLFYANKIQEIANLIYEELRYINDKDDNDRDNLEKENNDDKLNKT